MKFANTAYVLITSMTLVSTIKLIKEEYDRDMHTKTLVHVATEKKICDIEEHFGIMTLEYVKNKTSNNLMNESTATVKKTAPKISKMLNVTPNKKIEVLNNQTPEKHKVLIDQAPKNQKREEKMPCPTTNSEPITHEKSGTKPHIMKINQSNEGEQNPSLNNPHLSRQIDSGDEDQFTKAPNTNDGRKEHLTKAPHLKNDDSKKH